MNIVEFLKNKLDYTTDRLEEYISKYYIKVSGDYDNVAEFMDDVVNHGCVSGIISELIYYKDINSFYSKYENEIEELTNEIDSFSSVVMSLLDTHNINSIMDLKNYLVWFVFEETTRNLLDEYNSFME